MDRSVSLEFQCEAGVSYTVLCCTANAGWQRDATLSVYGPRQDGNVTLEPMP